MSPTHLTPHSTQGKNISLMEMTKVIPSMLWNYDFSFAPRTKDGPHTKRTGRGLDGVKSTEEPFWLDSSWFMEVFVSSNSQVASTGALILCSSKDFWCVARSRR